MPAPKDRFHLSTNFAFLCSAPLRDYLKATAERTGTTTSALCRTGLYLFAQQPKSYVAKDIGKRIIKNTTPSPRTATIPVTISKHLRVKDQPLRQWVTEYADKNNTTISTILRRAAYEYALKLNQTTDPTHTEDPQLLIDAWLHFDGRGSDLVRKMQERKAKADRTQIQPATKEDFKGMHVPWLKNPKRFSDLRDVSNDIFEKRDYKVPAPTSKDPDAWVLNGEW